MITPNFKNFGVIILYRHDRKSELCNIGGKPRHHETGKQT